MPDEYVYPAEARYRLGTLLATTAQLRGAIDKRRWALAYVLADQMDVLLNDPHLTGIRRADDITGRA